MGAKSDPELDERLFALLERTPPGHELSLREIAQAVGCSRSNIWLIEQSAMRKLEKTLSQPDLREKVRSLL